MNIAHKIVNKMTTAKVLNELGIKGTSAGFSRNTGALTSHKNLIITSLNLNSDGTMYITFSNGSIWYGTSTYTNPGWKQIPGGLKYISSNK